YALSNKPANVPWAILDQNRTPASRQLIHDIEATGYFLSPRMVASYDDGRALLSEGTVLAFVVIPQTFRRDIERGQPQVQLLVDGSDPLSAARVGGYIGQVAAVFAVDSAAPPGHRADAPLHPVGLLDVRQRFWFNPTLRDRDFFLAGLAGMLLT